MAYAAIVSLSQILAEQVIDVDQQQIKSLHEKLCFLQSFMEDYSYNSGERVDPLEERIRETAYEAEDVIELHILSRVQSERSLVFKYGPMQNLEKKYYKDLRRFNVKFDSIVEEAMKIKTNYETETLFCRRSLAASSSPIRRRSAVVGSDDDLQEMKVRLCGESPKLQIISIVGMGGIGTTLARNIFDDRLIEEKFDLRAWTTISQEYRMQDILVSLAKSLNARDECSSDEQYLARWIYQCLKLRRYLIIMDDMWSTKAWDEIRRVLPDDKNGSRVVITTRLSEVAAYADSSTPLYQMQLLNEDQGWSLLQEYVFAQVCCPPELENIGKTIAANCGGLPLAINLVAGLLSKTVRTVDHWEKFELTVSSTLTIIDEHLFNIFSLSYNNLPHHLRACFLYIGGFPEYHEIPISKLTMLWTAEGFLKPITSKSSEEVAEECVMDLVQRNLISVTKNSSNGRFRLCRIHDLLRDFCIKKAHDEKFLYIKKNGKAPQEDMHNNHRLCDFNYRSIPTKQTAPSFVLFVSNNHRYLMSLSVFSRLLRVLDGPKTYLTFIPAEVTGLVHLRYLAFSRDPYVHFLISARILKLRNLQTLIIGPQYRYSSSLHFLDEPKIHLTLEIWKMLSLRHLILNNCCFSPVPFTNIDGKFSVLKDLQTLSRVANFSFGKRPLK